MGTCTQPYPLFCFLFYWVVCSGLWVAGGAAAFAFLSLFSRVFFCVGGGLCLLYAALRNKSQSDTGL